MSQDYKEIAESVVARMRDELGVELKYDKESIEWLDGYINRISPQLNQENYVGLASALGAYLGQTIIATYGGAWDYNEKLNQWGIRFDDESWAFPFSKVYKQIEDGEFESISSFFRVLPIILKQGNG